MGQELKIMTRNFVVVLGLISYFLKAPRYFREKAVLARALLLALCPHPKEALVFGGSNPQIPLHFFEFHFPGTSQLVSPTCFHGDSSCENRTRRGAPDKVLWWAPNSGLQSRHPASGTVTSCPNQGPGHSLPPKLLPQRDPGTQRRQRGERQRRVCACIRVCP